MGQTVAEKTYHVRPGPNRLTVDVQALSPGLYWYRLDSPDRSEAGTISLLR
jgi:hypothetical protein